VLHGTGASGNLALARMPAYCTCETPKCVPRCGHALTSLIRPPGVHVLRPGENVADSGEPHEANQPAAAWEDMSLAYTAALARSDAWMRAYAVIQAYRPDSHNSGLVWTIEQIVLSPT
jgi:hypothetical protein